MYKLNEIYTREEKKQFVRKILRHIYERAKNSKEFEVVIDSRVVHEITGVDYLFVKRILRYIVDNPTKWFKEIETTFLVSLVFTSIDTLIEERKRRRIEYVTNENKQGSRCTNG